MRGGRKHWRSYAILIGISTALVLGLVLLANPWELANRLASADLGLIAFAVVLFVLGITLRALRWHLLLRASEQVVRPGTTFSLFAVAQALNDLTPVKVVGDGARIVGINRQEGVPIGTGLETIVVEKIMDLVLVTVLLIGSMLLLQPDIPTSPWTALAWVVGLVAAANVAVIIVLFHPGVVEKLGRVAVRIVGRTRRGWATKLEMEIDRAVESFNRALLLSRHGNRRLTALAALVTLPIWGLEFGRLTLVLAALGTFASLPAVVVASSLAITFQVFLPAGSGNVAVITDVFASMGIALATATAAGLLSVATSIWIAVPMALVAIALSGRSLKSYQEESADLTELANEAGDQPDGR
jgi:glycosyltransferase 2 family protein